MANKIKYAVSYELEVYASSPSEAMTTASIHVAAVAHRMRNVPKHVWDDEQKFPTGNISGAPHSGPALDGWRCLTTLGPKED